MTNKGAYKKWIIIGFSVIFVFGFGCGKWFTQWQYVNKQAQIIQLESEGIAEEEEEDEKKEEVENNIMIHVAGAVQAPGLYALPEGSRLDDVLKMAVLLPEANVDGQLNRAAILVDGQKVIVPNMEENQVDMGMFPVELSSAGQGQLININQANISELMNLPGIGQVKAQAIIDYRTSNGPFKSTEGLQQVKGIGSKTFESLEDKISI